MRRYVFTYPAGSLNNPLKDERAEFRTAAGEKYWVPIGVCGTSHERLPGMLASEPAPREYSTLTDVGIVREGETDAEWSAILEEHGAALPLRV
uniref:Uncharacterized protein n=1 Tax=viral metagenome TaxID=1070528 RepID=A0A6H1Z936_9ZZZZ